MNKYRTLIISDTHLGSDESKPDELFKFLKKNTSDNLILNGDIIDIKYLKSINAEINFEFIEKILDKKENKIFYLKGNHDSDIEKYISPYKNLVIKDYYEYVDFNKNRYCILHGHKYIFSNFVSDGRIAERFITWVIIILNHAKKIHSGLIFKKNKPLKKGLEYYTLADDSRSLIKRGLKIISCYKNTIKFFCDKLEVDGVICGHIHLPEIKKIGKYSYMNSGDFVENFSALVETHNGEWKIISK